MKIALAHLDLSMGSESVNIEKIAQAVDMAIDEGADWLITPETAWQGYFWYRENPQQVIEAQPCWEMQQVVQQASKGQLALFMGCAEYDEEQGERYNSLLIFDKEGKLVHRHHKVVSHCIGAEAWMTPWEKLTPFPLEGVRVGAMVCADAWYSEHPASLAEQGAELLVDSAAWPYGECCGEPSVVWQRDSRDTGLPMIVCNQTGRNPHMHMDIAYSAILEQGDIVDKYAGAEAVLLCDWDRTTGTFNPAGFKIKKF